MLIGFSKFILVLIFSPLFNFVFFFSVFVLSFLIRYDHGKDPIVSSLSIFFSSPSCLFIIVNSKKSNQVDYIHIYLYISRFQFTSLLNYLPFIFFLPSSNCCLYKSH